jgi:hypothetical protein
MPFLKYFLSILLLLAVLSTSGQSLVMSGNEIFEQESIPRKSKEKDKNTEKKYVKNKGEVKIPILKKENNGTPTNTPNKENKLTENDKKPKINTTSQENPQESNTLMEVFFFIVKLFVNLLQVWA